MAFGDHVRLDFQLTGQNATADYFTTRQWYALSGTAPTITSLVTYTDELEVHFRAEIVACLTTQCYFAGVRARWQIGSNEYLIESTSAAQAGTVSGTEELPEEDCVVFRRTTADTARNKRGRMFWPLVPEAFQDSGQLSAAGVTAYTALIENLNVQPAGDALTGDGVTLSPVQPDFKTSTLVPIVQWKLVWDLANRRDRRIPKKARAQGVG